MRVWVSRNRDHVNASKRKFYARDKEQTNAARRDRYNHDLTFRASRRTQINGRQHLCKAYMDSLKASGCIDCGNKNLTVLQFDHLNDKSRNIGDMRGTSWMTIEKEAAKCEVVCANCHMIRTASRRVAIGVAG